MLAEVADVASLRVFLAIEAKAAIDSGITDCDFIKVLKSEGNGQLVMSGSQAVSSGWELTIGIK